MAALIDLLCAHLFQLFGWVLPLLLGYLVSIYRFKAQVKLQSAAQRRAKRRERDEANFYLNLLITKGTSKLRFKPSLGVLERLLARGPKSVASELSAAASVARVVATAIPRHTAAQGIRSTCDVVFVKDNYAVVGVKVDWVDATVIIPEQHGERVREAWAKVMSFLAESPIDGADSVVEEAVQAQLVGLVEDALLSQLPDELAGVVKAEEGLDVTVEAKSAEDQAGYFYRCLKLVADRKRQ